MEGKEESKEYYVTVGVQYGNRPDDIHHHLGVTGNGYTVIEAPSYESARDLAFALFGKKFAFIYESIQNPVYYPNGEELRILSERTEKDEPRITLTWKRN